MKIIKRDGRAEAVRFDKIVSRIKKQTYNLDPCIEAHEVARLTITGIHEGISSKQIDDLAAETAASLTSTHPDYSVLAARISISALHKDSPKLFSEAVEILYHYVDPHTNKQAPLIAEDLYKTVQENKNEIDSYIVNDRDFAFDYFGFKTLEKSYLLKNSFKEVVERPQHLYMRVALGIWKSDLEQVFRTYDFLSEGRFTHATPTLFNAGTRKPQLSSCFLLAMQEDSLKGIYGTLSDIADISGLAGGIGLNIQNIRATGSYIRGTNGFSNGIIPMLRVFNESARYVDQGGGKRKGAFAVYIEPWHADVFEFLDLKKNHGKEEMRARDLFYALWIPDLFMERVNNDESWTLMCPDKCPGLYDVFDDYDNPAFTKLYTQYEKEGKGMKVVKARDLYSKILESQIETGTPYMLYKDSANRNSNQKNLGTIRSSNLCAEIIEYSSTTETAVCNLVSISLPQCITKKKKAFDFKLLYDITYQCTVNLNQVIDVNLYPTKASEKSNKKHRPIGIGVQGLADVFALLKLPFTSPEAKKLNKDIFETIYFAFLTASCDLAKTHGHYKSYPGSPLSKGLFHFDLFKQNEVGVLDGKLSITQQMPVELSGMYDWEGLRKQILEHGVRNSLGIALMPTASTSQILGNNECFEPYTFNIYKRRVLSGEYTIINKHLVRDLNELGIWNEDMKQILIAHNGSIQNINGIPANIKELYKTAYEIPQKDLIDMAADRQSFICQSQSFNLFVEGAKFSKLSNIHLYGWLKGLKTGSYYIRTQAAVDPIKGLGIEMKPSEYTAQEQIIDQSEKVCLIDDPDCAACGS